MNQFVKLTPSGDLYADGSILGVDANSDGVFEKEIELFEFARDNHFTHLILYDLSRVFDEHNPLVWNQRALQYQTLEEHLCRFMNDSRNFCIRTFGAAGGLGTLGNASEFDGDPSTMSPTPPMVLTQNEWNLIPRLRIVEDSTHAPGSLISLEAELYKSFLRLSRFNSQNACGVHFDYLTYENEFWNVEDGEEETSVDCQSTGFIDPACDSQPGSTCCNTSFCADDPFTSGNQITQSNEGFKSSKTFTFYQMVLPSLELLDEITQMSSSPLKIEMYVSSLYVGGIDSPARIVSSIDSWYHGDFQNQNNLVDRIALVHYQTSPTPFAGGGIMYDEFRQNNWNNLVEGGVPHTDIHPLVSAESIAHNGYDDYMGPYLDSDPAHTIFTFETESYEEWRTNISASNFNGPKENNVQPGGFTHYTSNMYLPYYSNPALFYAEGFPACITTSGSYPIDWSMFEYTGPSEAGIRYTFTITDLSGTISPFTVTGTSTDYSSFIPQAHFSSIDFQNSSVFTPHSLPLGNYVATLTLEYEFPLGCTYSYSCSLDVVNGPSITALTAQHPISFCEGNYVWLRSSAASGANSYTWQYRSDPNGSFSAVVPAVNSRNLKAIEGGFYRCYISNSTCGNDGASNEIEIIVNPNPPVHIFSECTASQRILLSVIPPGTSAPSNGPLLYKWSTGETTPTITVDYGDPIVYVYVYNLFSPECKQYGKIVIPSSYDPDDYYYFPSTPIVSSLPDDGNPCTENLSVSVQLMYHYDDDDGIIHNGPAGSPVYYAWSDGTIGNTLSYPLLGNSYSVSATRGLRAGCFNPATYTYSAGSPAGVPSSTIITKTDVTCPDPASGSFLIDLSASSGSVTFSYSGIPHSQCTTVANTFSATGLMAGSYTVDITELNGTACAATQRVTIQISGPQNPPQITGLNVNDASASCTGSNNTGSVTVSANGSGPFVYAWSNGASTASISGLTGGSYTVIVTDVNGCTVSATAHVEGYVAMNVTSAVLSQAGCSGSTGGSASVSVTGGMFPYSYSWNTSPVQTTPVATGLLAGTYICTVTDNNGCTLNSPPVVITQSSPITISISQTDVSCFGGSNGSATATVSGAVNPVYNWSPGGGTNLTTTNLSAGNYTFTVSDANQCTATANLTITQPPLLQVSFANQVNNVCIAGHEGQADANPAGGTAPYSYSWNSIPVQTSQTASGLTDGAYTLQVTDANGCTTQNSVVISTNTNAICCGQGSENFPRYPTPVNTSPGITYNVNLPPFLSTEFNASMPLNDNTFYIQEGMEWIVGNHVTLVLRNCTLQTCGNMWKGIVVRNGGEVIFENTIIMDAEYGVKMPENGLLHVDNSQFINNHVGIYYVPWNSHSGSFHINGSQFKGQGAMKGPYNGQLSDPGSKPLAGISLGDFSKSISSNTTPNIFENMNSGIIIQNANVQVINASFRNISPDPSISRNQYDGCGIYYADWQGGSLTVDGFGQYSSDLNFDRCKVGVRVAEGGAVIKNCTFGSSLDPLETAIECNYPGLSEIKITDNYIEAVNFGVNLSMFSGSASVEVSGNIINIGSAGGSVPRGKAVRVSDAGGVLINGNIPHPAYKISQNNINLVGAANSGISLEGANSFNVEHNIIHLTNSNSNLYGIYAENSDACEISCNEITALTGGGNLSSLSNQAGIRVKRSRLNSFGCNDIKNTRAGFRFDEPCNDTRIYGNTLGLHHTGLHIGVSGVIGPQPGNFGTRLPGNIWTESCLTWDAICENPIVYSYFFNDQSPYTQFTATTIDPPIWFRPDLRSNFECGPNSLSGPVSILGYCGSPSYLNEWGLTEADLDIIRDSLQFQEYNEELMWSMKMDLYEKLQFNSELLEDNQAFMDFYNAYIVTPIGGFIEVQELTSEYFNLDSAVSALVYQKQENIRLSQDATELLNQQLPNAGEQQVLLIETEIQNLQQDIETQETVINQLLVQYQNNALVVLNSALTENSIVQASSLIEENTQKVNEYFLSHFTNSGLSQSNPPPPGEFEVAAYPVLDQGTISELIGIAEQCPLSGGKAVYRARAMYAMLDPEKTYNDELICLNQGILYRQQKPQNVFSYFSLFPNPAQETITVRFEIAEEHNTHLVIRNNIGQDVNFNIVSPKQRELEINIHDLVNGIYTVQLLSEDVLLHQEKLVIIR